MHELAIVKKALWFANEVPLGLKGVYKRLNVYPPGTKYSCRFDENLWRVDLVPVSEGDNAPGLEVESQATFDLRDWMRAQLARVVAENTNSLKGGKPKNKKLVQVDFGSVDVVAGEALEKTIRANTKLPMEAFIVYATALLINPELRWRIWLRQCLSCKKVFYAKSTGGSRSLLCSVQCKRTRNAERVRRHRNKNAPQ
jgi:hypothetical protein